MHSQSRAQPNLSQRPLQPMLRVRSNLLDSNHCAAFGLAAQHDARGAVANEPARSKVLRQNEAVLQAGHEIRMHVPNRAAKQGETKQDAHLNTRQLDVFDAQRGYQICSVDLLLKKLKSNVF